MKWNSIPTDHVSLVHPEWIVSYRVHQEQESTAQGIDTNVKVFRPERIKLSY